MSESESSDHDTSSDDAAAMDDNSSDSEIDDVELEVKIDDEEYRQRRSKIDINPYDFQAHLDWIQATERVHGLFSEESYQAKREMANLFPLPEEIWLRWLKIDKRNFKNQIDIEEESKHEQLYKKYIQELHDKVLKAEEDYQCKNSILFLCRPFNN